MNTPRLIGENELHAYIDGALSDDMRAEVETWLADHPEERAKVDTWMAHMRGLHALYDGVLDEPVPPAVTDRLTARPAPHPVSWWKQAAAAVVLLGVGFAGGWGVHSWQFARQLPQITFIQQAVGAHVVFTGEKRHAVEVRADKEEQHLVRWLSRRLGQPIKPPPLNQAGFTLVGGRLVADRAGPAAQFMYEDAEKRRITLYVRRGTQGENTAFRYVAEDGVAAFYWIDQPLSYAVIARMEREELLRLARIVYASFER
jgi:anti-sigma factor RsiW